MNRLAILTAGLILASCGPEAGTAGEELPDVDCAAQPVPTFFQVEAFGPTLCGTCHSSVATDRHGSPPSLNFDQYGSARANARKAAHEVFEGTMPPAPPASTVVLTDPQKQALYLWALCGTPQ